MHHDGVLDAKIIEMVSSATRFGVGDICCSCSRGGRRVTPRPSAKVYDPVGIRAC
jgi:hypothetical protein